MTTLGDLAAGVDAVGAVGAVGAESLDTFGPHPTGLGQGTLRDIAALQQLIPVCPSCRKSHPAHMSETALNEYVQAHPEMKFQDLVCSTCAER